MSQWFYKLLGEEIGPVSSNDLINAVASGHIDDSTYVRKAESDDWDLAGNVKGLFERGMKQREQEEETRRSEEERLAGLVVSTCAPSPHRDFEVIDTIFAIDSDGARAFFAKDGDPNVAFHRVKNSLKLAAYNLGADAVVSCQFEYRIAVGTSTFNAIGKVVGAMGGPDSQVIEIFAYGTAIKYQA